MVSADLKVVKKAVLKYCAFRERTTKEVKEYIKKFRLSSLDEGNLLCDLIESDVVNDFRFAKMYVGGKFRMNGWGKDKIAYHLRSLGISDTIIDLALEEIDDEDYKCVAKKFVDKKRSDLGSEISKADANKKIFNYLKSKGFESDLILSLIKVSE